MPDVAQSSEIATWANAGGLVVFASVVLWELRQLRPLFQSLIKERQDDRDIMSKIKEVLAQILERERMRSEQRAELIRQRRDSVPTPRHGSREARENYAFDDVTDTVSMPTPPERPKVKSNPRGVPVGRYGPVRPPRDDNEDE